MPLWFSNQSPQVFWSFGACQQAHTIFSNPTAAVDPEARRLDPLLRRPELLGFPAVQTEGQPKLARAKRSFAKGLTILSVGLMVNPKIKPIPGLFRSKVPPG